MRLCTVTPVRGGCKGDVVCPCGDRNQPVHAPPLGALGSSHLSMGHNPIGTKCRFPRGSRAQSHRVHVSELHLQVRSFRRVSGGFAVGCSDPGAASLTAILVIPRVCICGSSSGPQEQEKPLQVDFGPICPQTGPAWHLLGREPQAVYRWDFNAIWRI